MFGLGEPIVSHVACVFLSADFDIGVQRRTDNWNAAKPVPAQCADHPHWPED